MTHLSSREIDGMNVEQRQRRLEELREEMLQLRAQHGHYRVPYESCALPSDPLHVYKLRPIHLSGKGLP